MTPRAHLVTAATALSLSRGGMVLNDAAILSLSSALERVGALRDGDALCHVHLAACGVIEARLASNEYGYGFAQDRLRQACHAYLASKLVEVAA
jgi:hypothetical protein